MSQPDAWKWERVLEHGGPTRTTVTVDHWGMTLVREFAPDLDESKLVWRAEQMANEIEAVMAHVP